MSTGMNAGVGEVELLFRDSVTPREALKPARDASWWVLIIFAAASGVYLCAVVVVLLAHPRDSGILGIYAINPVATIGTIGKLVLVGSLALIGAYNGDVRREALIFLCVVQFVAVAVSLWLFFGFRGAPMFPELHEALIPEAAAEGIALCVFMVMLWTMPSRGSDSPVVRDAGSGSPASRLLGLLLVAYGILFSALAVTATAARGLLSPGSILGGIAGGPDLLLAGTIAEYSALGVVCFFLSSKSFAGKYFIPVLILNLTVGAVASSVCSLQGGAIIATGAATTIRVAWLMPVQVALNAGLIIVLVWLRGLHYRLGYEITALGPGSAECVMALHCAFRETAQRPAESETEVLKRVDEYIVGIRGRQRGIIAFPFWMVEHVFPSLAWFRPPFSTMSRDEQRWMLRRYVIRPSYERERALIPLLADATFRIGDSAHSLLTFAYFSSSSGQAEVGYILPNARERMQPDIAGRRPPERDEPLPLPESLDDPIGRKPSPIGTPFLITPRVSVPDPSPDLPSSVDYCIVGSGAAGGVLAYRLATAKGGSCSICVLERGGYFSPVQHFNDDEMQMVRLLYEDGGLQTTQNLDFTILQGQCVGGSTVINNAICFEMPGISRSEWRGFGIDVDGLGSHYDRVAREINIGEMTSESINSRVEELFSLAVDRFSPGSGPEEQLSPAHRMRGNFSNCVGCGLCNIGCRRLRKLSVLETYIPWAEAHGVRVIPHTTALKCTTVTNGGRKKVTSLVVRKPNGDIRTLQVNRALIVAAGAIASSRFLMRSSVGGRNVGKGLACNYAFPLIVESDRRVDAFDGLQMTMFAAPENHEVVFETTFNPPGTQSVMVAEYFDRHERMMKAYRNSMVIIALVGSDPSGLVSSRPGLLYGRAVEWNQTADEIARIKRAFSIGARIAKGAGATRIHLPSIPVLEIPCDKGMESVLESFRKVINEKRYFQFATPHPQGGNMMAADSVEERVVGTDFRVRDCENLFVCDASVFPRGIRVNPQWTIMALASAAGDRIAAET